MLPRNLSPCSTGALARATLSRDLRVLEPYRTRRRAAVSRTVEWRMARVHLFAARAGIVGGGLVRVRAD